ncbi:hypothetical protein [Streptomyces scopuliridis]|uniref:Uncharacterized protein n=1 Tax=Streptomyces scopuliridis TaxID=452529 RepID=A0ACD4ZTV8_9ACTN|nr:hypothetical protein [Streptomyces scopuliridis]WSC01227.1 hypothetical protein OG835_32350 [Streptomyces scopuliridis]
MTVTTSPPSTNHGPDRWTKDDGGSVSGLVISTTALQAGERAVLETMLHEAAHLTCWIRGVQDTASRGYYHNAAFAAAADDVGLEWPEDSPTGRTSGGRGYASPRLSQQTAEHYAADLERLTAVIPDALPHLVVPTSRPESSRKRLGLQCAGECKRKVWVAPTVYKAGPILCGICGTEFAPVPEK